MCPRHSGNGSFLEGATKVILKHLENEHFGVSELARELGMSRSNLHRKVHALTGKSASQFIREVRLNKALELLKASDLTISEVAYKVGFGSATYFSKCFHDHFGYTPGETGQRDVEKTPPANPQIKSDTFEPIIHWFSARWMIPFSMLVLAAIALIIFFKPFSVIQNPKDIVIAVLPFRNDSPDQQNEYIVNGLMEEIMTKLSSLQGVSVVSRTTSESYRDSDKNLPQIGRELQANYILEGSATFLNNQTRIRIQLIKTATDSHVWSEPYERLITKDNLFRIQEEVALAVADELDLVLNPDQQKDLERKPTENMEAYQAYLEARNLLHVATFLRVNKPDDPRFTRMKQLTDHAITLDTSFSEAYTLLAQLYIYTLS